MNKDDQAFRDEADRRRIDNKEDWFSRKNRNRQVIIEELESEE